MVESTLNEVLIGGRWLPAAGGTYPVIDPATEEIAGRAHQRLSHEHGIHPLLLQSAQLPGTGDARLRYHGRPRRHLADQAGAGFESPAPSHAGRLLPWNPSPVRYT